MPIRSKMTKRFYVLLLVSLNLSVCLSHFKIAISKWQFLNSHLFYCHFEIHFIWKFKFLYSILIYFKGHLKKYYVTISKTVISKWQFKQTLSLKLFASPHFTVSLKICLIKNINIRVNKKSTFLVSNIISKQWFFYIIAVIRFLIALFNIV